MNMGHSFFFVFSVGLALPTLLCRGLMAEQTNSLQGRIMDTSDNWLPDVRVALQRSGAATRTDGNGLFTLTFSRKEPLVADEKGVYECLELDKEGYLGRTVEIRDLSYFGSPIAEKMEPNPVGEDNVGFSVRMSTAHSVHGLDRALGSPEPGTPISEADFRRVLSRMETIRTNEPTDRVWFHVYVPKTAGKLRAAFLLSRHGIGTIDHPRLRAFADRHNIALVGILGNPVQRGCYPVSLLDEHIRKLGEMVHHPELANLPVLTFGHSNGTGFATIYPSQRPERVIAWISYHSGWSFHLQFPGIEAVPGLVLHGQKDEWIEHGQEQTVKHLRRDRNAAVAMMIEGNVGHGPLDPDATWALIVEFCEAAMRVRLNDDGSLRPVQLEQGWLGANYDRAKGGQQDLAIAPYAQFQGERSIANWLPDEGFAKVWRAYGRTDPRAGK
jgi:hypothetical protein